MVACDTAVLYLTSDRGSVCYGHFDKITPRFQAITTVRQKDLASSNESSSFSSVPKLLAAD